MFDDVLIESAGKDKTKGRGVTTIISVGAHVVIIGLIMAGEELVDAVQMRVI